jgi:hypothetical protein
MFLQAHSLGLAMHQMAGFDHNRFRRERLPAGFEPGTMIAIGYPAGSDALIESAGPSGAVERDRGRLPLTQFVFGARWGAPAAVLDSSLAASQPHS